jgi:hypothetical protein
VLESSETKQQASERVSEKNELRCFSSHDALAVCLLLCLTGALAMKFQGKVGGSSEGTGAPVRLHSALLAVLTHLVGKVKGLAIKDPQVRGGDQQAG